MDRFIVLPSLPIGKTNVYLKSNMDRFIDAVLILLSLSTTI